ncbi:MAG: 50S ribosomal protein L5 [Candidatus Aquicultorales bacterium]
MPRLKEAYLKEIIPAMMKEFEYSNPMQVPRPEKIVVNMGVGEAAAEAKQLDGAIADLTTIAGQKPIIRKAKKSIAGFKIRAGMPVGVKVTLRGNRMYEFLDRLIAAALPRIRDFRGLNPNSFDGRGNYTFGVTEQLIFPEIDYDKIDRTRGMDITIVISGMDDNAARALLKHFNFPFKER